MKQLPDKFSVYAKTLEEAKYITEKQKELCGDCSPKHRNVYYRFSIYREIDKFGFSSQSYLSYNIIYEITQEFTFEEFKSYFEEQTIPDFKIKGTKLPLINESIEFTVSRWNSFDFEVTNMNNYFWNDSRFCYSHGYTVRDNITYILLERIDYEGNNFFMFKEEDLIRLYKKQNNIEDMENKQIIGYKLVKPEYERAASEIVGNEVHCNFRYSKEYKNYIIPTTNFEKTIKILKEAGVLDLWFEPVMAETKRILTLSNGKSVKITKEGVEAEGKLIKIKYIENLFCNTNTFGDTGWTIRYNSFDIGCYRNLKREDLSKIIETYSLIK